MAEYELYLTTPLGGRIATITRFRSLLWSRRVNNIGWLSLSFGAEQYDRAWWGKDRRVEVWRVTGIAKLIRTYYLQRVYRVVDSQGREIVTWLAWDANGLLDGRIVDAYAGSPEATKTDYADDISKAVVYEQLGAGAVAARQVPGLTVQPDMSAAPSITRGFSRRNVLTVLQSIAESSATEGTRLYYDIVEPTTGALEFRTYINQRGTDRTTVVTPFSLLRGTLSPPVSLDVDHTDERNYAYTGGQGEGEEREIVEVSNATAIAASAFARREVFVDGRDSDSTAALEARGNAQLWRMRTRRLFEAYLADVPRARYQVDWDFGDLVTAEYDAELYDCVIEAVQGRASEDGETIEARLFHAG